MGDPRTEADLLRRLGRAIAPVDNSPGWLRQGKVTAVGVGTVTVNIGGASDTAGVAVVGAMPAVDDLVWLLYDQGTLICLGGTIGTGTVAIFQADNPTNTSTSNNANEQTQTTLNIPAQPFAYKLECASLASQYNTVADDLFVHRIKVDGTAVAQVYNRHLGGINFRLMASLCTSHLTDIAANTACTVTYTIQRSSGTGVLTYDTTVIGHLTGRCYFGI